jgi:uncharacterized protein (TIGR04255 family)
MAQRRHLENAPITEALVDFRVSLPKEFDAEVFADLKATLADRYPVAEKMRQSGTRIEVTAGKPAFASIPPRLLGYRFRSTDGLDLGQFRVNGFTYSRLAPYTAWAKLFPEAWRLWTIYVATVRPPFVSRVALRYINHLRLPIQQGDDLERYLSALPPMPPGAPGGFSGFVSRINTFDPASGLSANVTQALEGPGAPTIILDIDVYKAGEFGIAEGALQPIFQALHSLKNDIFFGTITEETANYYEHRHPA